MPATAQPQPQIVWLVSDSPPGKGGNEVATHQWSPVKTELLSPGLVIIFANGRHAMLPNGELHVLSIRQGDENHQFNCHVLVRPTGQILTSSSSGRIILLPSSDSTASRIAVPPVIVESVQSVGLVRAREALLPCVFHGHPPPKIKSVSYISFIFLCSRLFYHFQFKVGRRLVQEPNGPVRQFAPSSHPPTQQPSNSNGPTHRPAGCVTECSVAFY